MAQPRWLNEHEQQFWRVYFGFFRGLETALTREVEKSGLSGAEYTVLVPLSESPEGRIRARDLCRQLGWDRTRLSHLVGRMERRGLVSRSVASDDARGSIVEITADGRRAIEDAAPAHVEAVRRHFIDHLDDQEMATMTNVFRRVLDGLPPR
jgi:DNA-binding MarR family transcriptional regulator